MNNKKLSLNNLYILHIEDDRNSRSYVLENSKLAFEIGDIIAMEQKTGLQIYSINRSLSMNSTDEVFYFEEDGSIVPKVGFKHFSIEELFRISYINNLYYK